MSIIKKFLISLINKGVIFTIRHSILRIKDEFFSNYITRNTVNNSKLIDNPIILITQIQRSGGTLLSQLFDGHPEIYAYPNELTIWKPKWKFKDLSVNFKSIDNDYNRFFALTSQYKKESKSKWNKFYKFYFDLSAQKKIFHKYLDKKNSQRNILNSYFSSFFSSWLNYKNNLTSKKYITAFVPRALLYKESIEYFFKNYPDGKIITVVRDPLDWLASAKIHDPKNYSNFEIALNLWKESTIASMNIGKNKNVICVSFFDLVKNTPKVIKMICKKFSIRENEILLKPTFNGEPIMSDSSFKSVEGKIDKNTLSRKKNLFKKKSLKS